MICTMYLVCPGIQASGHGRSADNAPASSADEVESDGAPMETAAGAGSKPVKMMKLKFPTSKELASIAKAAKVSSQFLKYLQYRLETLVGSRLPCI